MLSGERPIFAEPRDYCHICHLLNFQKYFFTDTTSLNGSVLFTQPKIYLYLTTLTYFNPWMPRVIKEPFKLINTVCDFSLCLTLNVVFNFLTNFSRMTISQNSIETYLVPLQTPVIHLVWCIQYYHKLNIFNTTKNDFFIVLTIC